jgi:dephospho-CoA kinase
MAAGWLSLSQRCEITESSMASRTRVIGLTGGIGSGKSTVVRRLVELGALAIDADKVGHEIYLPATPGFAAVVEAFGQDIVATDGTIDRRALGAKVFGDADALARLNAIAHPRIAEAIRERIERLRTAGETRPVVLEAAVLIEAGWKALVDEVWVVVAPPPVAIDRLARDRGLSREEAARRIAAQLTNEGRAAHADVVIANDGALDDLVAEVDRVFRERIGAA